MQQTSNPKCNVFPNLLWLGVVAGLAGCSEGEKGSSVPAALQADLQSILDDAVANETTPGAVIYVSGGDGESWSAASGVHDLQQNTAMAPDERFRAGSIMKVFVATTVLQAVEAGKFELDDAITEYLPDEVTARIENAEAIQIGMLLGHRSGIPEWVEEDVVQAIMSDPGHIWSLDEILAEATKRPALFPPGEGFGYSNTNYTLLGEIVSRVSGRSWRDVIRDQILARSGLDHTSLPEEGDLECPTCAHGYVPVGDELLDFTRVDPSMAGPGGGSALVTTPADLARFLRELRGGALFERASTVETMFAFQEAFEPESHVVGYGLGVMKLQKAEYIALGHLGGTAGYQSFTLYVPATNRYVSGFINVLGDLAAVLDPVLERVAQP